MSKDKNYKQLLSYLDDILSYLVNDSENYKVNFYVMIDKVFEIKTLEKTTTNKSLENNFEKFVEEIFSKIDDKNNSAKDLRLATIHLQKEGLIEINSSYEIEITFRGLLAYSEGVVNKWDSELSISQRLYSVQDEQLLQNSRMVRATEQMNNTNKSIRSLTFWIVFGALVSIVYQVVELIKTFFPYLFCEYI